MAEESSTPAPLPPELPTPPPPTEHTEIEPSPPPVPKHSDPPAVLVTDKEIPPPHESKSLAAMMEKEEPPPSPPPTAESELPKEEAAAVEAGKEKLNEEQQKFPQTLISFKEESNQVGDLSDSEKKALDEIKQLVQEALNSHHFTSPPPPPLPEKTEPTVSESDVSTEINPPSQDPKQSEPEQVSIWGIPLLKDDRSDVILLKFLRARDFKVKEAFAMMKNTIQWRKDFKIDELIDEDLGDDLEKVVFMHGHDREGHPVCYNVYGEFQNKDLYNKTFSDEEKRRKFLQWRIQFLERSIRKLDFSPGGVSTIFQVNDLKNSPGPGKRELRLATSQALQLLQDNYPEFVAKQVDHNP